MPGILVDSITGAVLYDPDQAKVLYAPPSDCVVNVRCDAIAASTLPCGRNVTQLKCGIREFGYLSGAIGVFRTGHFHGVFSSGGPQCCVQDEPGGDCGCCDCAYGDPQVCGVTDPETGMCGPGEDPLADCGDGDEGFNTMLDYVQAWSRPGCVRTDTFSDTDCHADGTYGDAFVSHQTSCNGHVSPFGCAFSPNFGQAGDHPTNVHFHDDESHDNVDECCDPATQHVTLTFDYTLEDVYTTEEVCEDALARLAEGGECNPGCTAHSHIGSGRGWAESSCVASCDIVPGTDWCALAIARLPAYDGDFDDGCDAAKHEGRDADEVISCTIARFIPKFWISEALGVDVIVTYNEHFTADAGGGSSDTPKTITIPAGSTEVIGDEVFEPSDDGVIEIRDVACTFGS